MSATNTLQSQNTSDAAKQQHADPPVDTTVSVPPVQNPADRQLIELLLTAAELNTSLMNNKVHIYNKLNEIFTLLGEQNAAMIKHLAALNQYTRTRQTSLSTIGTVPNNTKS